MQKEDTTNNVRVAIKKGGTQTKVSEQLGVSRVAVGKWCANGRVPWDKLYQFCLVTKTHPKLVNETAAQLFRSWGK